MSPCSLDLSSIFLKSSDGLEVTHCWGWMLNYQISDAAEEEVSSKVAKQRTDATHETRPKTASCMSWSRRNLLCVFLNRHLVKHNLRGNAEGTCLQTRQRQYSCTNTIFFSSMITSRYISCVVLSEFIYFHGQGKVSSIMSTVRLSG